MKLFRSSYNRISTNPDLPPSKRLETVVFSRLQPKGYKYLKSKSEFVKEFPLGDQRIQISYNSSFGYISQVEYYVIINFKELEKCFKRIFPEFGKTRANNTLAFYVYRTNNWLCNEKSGKYSDKTINRNANEFFEKALPEIESIFSRYQHYQELYKAYTELETNWKILPVRLEKLITNGLILAKNIDPSQYEGVKNKYLERLQTYKGGDAKQDVDFAIKYIESNPDKIKMTYH